MRYVPLVLGLYGCEKKVEVKIEPIENMMVPAVAEGWTITDDDENGKYETALYIGRTILPMIPGCTGDRLESVTIQLWKDNNEDGTLDEKVMESTFALPVNGFCTAVK